MSTTADKKAALRERIARLEQDQTRVAEKLLQAKAKLDALDAAPVAPVAAVEESSWRAGPEGASDASSDAEHNGL